MDLFLFGHGFEPAGFPVLQVTTVPPRCALTLYSPPSSSQVSPFSQGVMRGDVVDGSETNMEGVSVPNLLMGPNSALSKDYGVEDFVAALHHYYSAGAGGRVCAIVVADATKVAVNTMVPLSQVFQECSGQGYRDNTHYHWCMCRGMLAGGAHQRYHYGGGQITITPFHRPDVSGATVTLQNGTVVPRLSVTSANNVVKVIEYTGNRGRAKRAIKAVAPPE
jgi:hypothetical protein